MSEPQQPTAEQPQISEEEQAIIKNIDTLSKEYNSSVEELNTAEEAVSVISESLIKLSLNLFGKSKGSSVTEVPGEIDIVYASYTENKLEAFEKQTKTFKLLQKLTRAQINYQNSIIQTLSKALNESKSKEQTAKEEPSLKSTGKLPA